MGDSPGFLKCFIMFYNRTLYVPKEALLIEKFQLLVVEIVI